MFGKFNLDKYKQMKPPSDNSFETMQEIKQINTIPMDRSSVKKFDNIGKTLPSMNTASYPSGHSAQGILISKVLADKYPKLAKKFLIAGKNISDSRRVAKAHYKSDSKLGELMGEDMYQFIKNKV